jgi:predicted GNAT family acetyltransferase
VNEVPRVVVHPDARAFLERARSWLEEREDENNIFLGLAAALADAPQGVIEDEPFFATVERRDQVAGCALRTPPHKPLLTRMPLEAGRPLAEALASRFHELPAVLGPEDVTEAVARAWSARKGVAWRRGMPQRIYRLDAVTPPEGVPGRLRLARDSDLELVHRWGDAFGEELGRTFRTTPERRVGFVRDGLLHLWEDGVPVCMAVTLGHTARGVRVGYVYTPPEARRRGYASACVAAVSQRMLDSGRSFCVLYTDLTNPTSNAIYQRIGYRPLLDVTDMVFEESNA